MRGYFENSMRLTRFMLRRERVISVVWIVIMLFFAVVIPPVLNIQFGSPEDLQGLMITMQNPAMIAMMGQIYGSESLDTYTVGAMYSNMMLLFSILAVVIMNIFLVARHTRTDEEKGRIEVIRSLPVGRLANIHAAMITAVIVNFILAVLVGLAMAALGIESMGFGGSMLFGAALGASGLFFAAVSALFAQLSSTSRGATGYSFVAMLIFYLVRAVGDINNEVLSLISPLGLILRAQVYVKNYWWPVFVILLFTIAIVIAAYYLNTIRDMDQGFIPAKPGKKNASVFLRTSFGLSVRLMRNMFLAWTIGMFAFGASYGSVMGDIETFIGENEFFLMILPEADGFEIAELFITMLNMMLSICCVAPVFMMAFKLRGEEKDHRAENILSRSVSRTNYLMGYVVMAFAASVIMPFMAVLGLWSASAPTMEVPIAFGSMFKAMMVYVPALWVMLGFAVLFVGLFPKATIFCWGYFGYAFIAGYMGPMLDMPDWAQKISPFGYIPQLPLEEINVFTLVMLSVISAVLICVGFVFYRKRDMQA